MLTCQLAGSLGCHVNVRRALPLHGQIVRNEERSLIHHHIIAVRCMGHREGSIAALLGEGWTQPSQLPCRQQLVKRKEESMEVGGSFICNGLERIIRMLIQQRRHYIMALRRSAYQKRGNTFTDAATLLR